MQNFSRNLVVPVVLYLLAPSCASTLKADDRIAWKAGFAKAVITPKESMWMAGYASRKKPSEGTQQDLFAKALALEDEQGTRLIIVTTDLVGIPRALREWLEVEVEKKLHLPPRALLLNASHTHCGPELRTARATSAGLPDDRIAQSKKYVDELQTSLLKLIEESIANLSPAKLSYTHGRAGFAMNRRLPTEKGFINAPYPDGPVDHDVPVLKVEGTDGKLRGLLFSYACHNTTLSFFQFCGDYAGYAQQYLEEAHPDITAMFLTGCGGDQNPQPRGTVDYAQQHGRALANAVAAALLGPPRAVNGPIHCALKSVPIDFADPPSREELEKLTQSTDTYDQRRAKSLLNELRDKGEIRRNYSYFIQAIRLGDDLLLVALAGEVVVDYSLRLKQELAGKMPVWIAAYSNDVFGYVPSRRVLLEGGYEAGGAMRFSTLPGSFAPTIEESIIQGVHATIGEVSPKKTLGKQ